MIKLLKYFFRVFRILIEIAESIKQANERLNFYCIYDNTLDKIATDAAQNLEKQHLINYEENDLNCNSLFDELLMRDDDKTSTPNATLAVSTVKIT